MKLATDDIKYRYNTSLSHVKQHERALIEKIITSYHDVFSLPGDPLLSTKLSSHRTVLKDQKPINIRQYKHPEFQTEEISN